MKEKFILALDQGTTSSRAILFNRAGRPVASAQKEFRQYFPEPGRVEHDPAGIWSSQAGVASEAIARAGIDSSSVEAIGITNQRETVILWNRKTGRPLAKAIVWQDRRTSDYCDQLVKDGLSGFIAERTGLVIDAYFSATKLKWMLDNIEGARKQASRGELAFGTVDSWLLWNLSGGRIHATDLSNASRTMLFNIHTLQWDPDLLKLFDIPESVLPGLRSSCEVYCNASALLAGDIPVAGIAGDQQAALFGQMCVDSGMVKNTYGTGCFMMMNTGSKPALSKNRLLTTLAWQIDGITTYALEGSIFVAGAVVQWLRDSLGIIKTSKEVEKIASSVPDSGGVYFVPAFAGLGAPYWQQHCRGLICGLTRGSTDAHIARAALDSIAYQTMDVLDAMRNDSATAISELRIDGGASVNDALMQFQADLLEASVVRPAITETTALGAAYMAGLATGFWSDIEELKKHWQAERVFAPSCGKEEREKLIRGWRRAVDTAIHWSAAE